MSNPNQQQLINWDDRSRQTIIANSDWLCPPEGPIDYSDIEQTGREFGGLTVSDARLLVGDQLGEKTRPQHLRLTTYPEGYHVVSIHDTITGTELNDSRSTTRLFLGDNGTIQRLHFLAAGSIAITEDKEIFAFTNRLGISHTTIRPTLGEYEDTFSRADLTPSRRSLHVQAGGTLSSNYGVEARFSTKEQAGRRESHLSFWDTELEPGQLSALQISMDAVGRVYRIAAKNKSILEKLKIPTNVMHGRENDTAIITEPSDQYFILHGIAEAVGFSHWQDLHIPDSTAAIYAKMGQPDLDPTQHLVTA
jgi:hypothetical protein